jgi:hypothetical protein
VCRCETRDASHGHGLYIGAQRGQC